MAMTNGSLSIGNASMTMKDVPLQYCEPISRVVLTKSIFHGEDPLQFSLPILLLQIVLLHFISRTLQFFLKPFNQLKFVPEILGGILMGPSFLGHNEKFNRKLFSQKALRVLDVYDQLGFMFLSFMLAVRIDIGLLKKTRRMELIIGLASLIVPLIITLIATFFVRKIGNMDENLHRTLPMVAYAECTTSMQVIFSLLIELKLVNSELGHLALSSSSISNLSSLIIIATAIFVKQGSQIGSKQALIASHVCKVFIIIVVVFVFRPIMLWMIRRTPEGKTLKEAYICAVTLMFLVSSLLGEVSGNLLLGPVIFGLAVPAGLPLGSSLTDKLDCFVSTVLMPCYIINLGRKVNVFVIELKTFLVVEIITLVATLAKFLAIIISSMYFKVPFQDAFSLGLIMNCQGFIDIQRFDRLRNFKLINEDCFAIMVIMTVVHSAAFPPLVRVLYDPARRYVSYRRRTIQHARRNTELRILVCLHGEEDVPTIINILETSNPTRESPISIYVLNLVKLVGRCSPLFIPHRFDQIPSSKPTRINNILKAFERYELYNQDIVTIQCFTTMSLYATMHDDICTLALEKSTSMVIIPFHRSDSLLIRTVHKNVLDKAPCSVGILVIPEMVSNSRSILAYQLDFMNVCALFLGGPDDREALAYAARMAKHPSIRLTVHRIVGVDHSTGVFSDRDKRLDTNAIKDFRMCTLDNKHVVYKEESVRRVIGTTRVLESLVGSDYELILVGRSHDNESPLLEGLAEWSEIEELGIIGDMLASADFKCKASVLVVQQQASVVEEMVESPRFIPK